MQQIPVQRPISSNKEQVGRELVLFLLILFDLSHALLKLQLLLFTSRGCLNIIFLIGLIHKSICLC